MRKDKFWGAITTLLATSMVSCMTTHEAETIDTYDSSITFLTSQEELESRGTPILNTSTMESVGIFATLSTTPYWSCEDQSANFMNNVELSRDGLSWSYNPVQQWPTDDSGLISFFAYSPYSSNSSNGMTLNEDVAGGIPTIKYRVPSRCTNQPDLMVACPQLDMAQQSECVKLEFRHALATLSFSVRGAENLSISNIYLENIINEATLSLVDEDVVWSDFGEPANKSYRPTIEDIDQRDEGETTLLTTSDGYLMMIPQSSDGVVIRLSIKGESSREYTLSGGGEWLAGQHYNYTIDLDFQEEIPQLFTEVANCYMLDPTTYNTFYIPLEERIEDFWRNYSGVSSSQLSYYLIDGASEWSPSILWSEFMEQSEDCISITQATEAEIESIGSSAEAMLKISINDPTLEGNLLVGVEREVEGVSVILWSWHLWITDYNPTNHGHIASEEDEAYSVPGGEIHRYSDAQGETAWTDGGLYNDKFIMDRNIGSLDCDLSDVGILLFQWGRKDPFPISVSRAVESSTVSFATTVMNPTTLYCESSSSSSYGWCSEKEFTTTEARRYIWCDTKALNPLVDGVIPTKEKSIFDPSPPGWRLPLSIAFEGISVSCQEFWYRDIAYFPPTGSLNYMNGGLEGSLFESMLWMANPCEQNNYSYSTLLGTDSFSINGSNRSTAMGLRAIEE